MPVDTDESLSRIVFGFPQMKHSFLMSNPPVSLLLSLEGIVDELGCWSPLLEWNLSKLDLLVYLARHDLWNATLRVKFNMSCCKGQSVSYTSLLYPPYRSVYSCIILIVRICLSF